MLILFYTLTLEHMKHFFHLILLLSVCTSVKSQINGDYRSQNSGSWNNSGTWERFNGSFWQTNPPAPTSADGNVSIQNTHTVTVPNGQNITVDDVTIQTSGQLTVNGIVNVTSSPAAFEVIAFG